MIVNNKKRWILFVLAIIYGLPLAFTQTSVCTAELTSEEATIIIPSEAAPTLNGDTLVYGTIIRAVYEVDGEKRCAGQTIWDGENTYISVVGNDASPPEVNGYDNGEEYTFCYILPSGCIINNVSVTYLSGSIFNNGDSFTADGISGVESMTGLMDFSLAIDTSQPDTCSSATGALSVTSLNGQAPIDYTWSNGSTGASISGLSANDTLTVQAIDANQCSASLQSIVLSSPCPTIEASGTSNEDPTSASGCSPFEVNFQNTSIPDVDIDSLIWQFGDGDFSTNIDNPTHTYENVGSYTALLIVYDGFQYDTASFSITVTASPEVNITSIEFDNCLSNQVTITASSAGQIINNWNWDFDQGVVITESDGNFISERLVLFPSVNTSFNYTLSIDAGNTCQQTINGSIDIPNAPEFLLSVDDIVQPTCQEANGSISVLTENGLAPYQFSWSHNETIDINQAMDLPAANYTISATDINGCTASLQVALLDETHVPLVNLGPDLEFCENENMALIAGTDGNLFQWYNEGVIISGANTNELNVNTSGLYSVEVSNENCIALDEILITIQPTPIITGVQDASICEGDVLSLDVNCPGCTYSWNTGSTSPEVDLTLAGFYAVTVNSNFPCSATTEMNLTLLENPTIDLGEDLVICDGEGVFIGPTAQQGISYQWQSGETTSMISVNNEGQYTLSITDENSCQAEDILIVSIEEPLSISIVTEQERICYGDSITITASGGEDYQWISGLENLSDETAASPSVYPSVPTNYSVIGYNMCFSDTAQIFIDIFEQTADAGPDTCIVVQSEIELSASGGTSYLWQENPFLLGPENSPTPNVAPSDSTWFFVQIIDKNNCTLTDSVLVAVIKAPLSLIEPINIITPNGDGDNDVLVFEGLEKFTQNELVVFNRWGKTVLKQLNYQNDWDGTFNGAELPAGVYFYILTIREEEIKSSLTILRG